MSGYKNWLYSDDIKPYIYVRKENRPSNPGTLHDFSFPAFPIMKEPLVIGEEKFAYQLLKLENKAFEKQGLTLPRWALFDCYVMPGIICGFAMKQKAIPDHVRKALPIDESLEWVPLSLFIAIPSNEPGCWVANNLCSINSLISKDNYYSSIGYLSKAYGLWYGNMKSLYGVTQWSNIAAIKIHSNFGLFQLFTAYSPIHDIKTTLTYKVEVDARYWTRYLDEKLEIKENLLPTDIIVDPNNEQQLIELQKRMSEGAGPYFLNSDEVAVQKSLSFKLYTM